MASGKEASRHTSREPPKGTTTRRVLIVEDNAALRSLLARLLRDTGRCKVVGEIGRALEAASAVRRTRPDLVVMDDSLPDADPVEATHDITRLFLAVQVVAFTSRSDPATVANFLAAGAITQFDKTDIDGLIEWIAQHPSGLPDRQARDRT